MKPQHGNCTLLKVNVVYILRSLYQKHLYRKFFRSFKNENIMSNSSSFTMISAKRMLRNDHNNDYAVETSVGFQMKYNSCVYYYHSVAKSPYTLFYINNTFIRNARLKLLKNQASVKPHPEAERLLRESYSHSSSTLSSQNKRICSKK